MPMPMIVTSGGIPAVTELPVSARAPVRDSRRIPAIFLPPTSTSFGHLSLVSTRATRRSASAVATAVARDSVARSACGSRGRTMIEASRLVPAGARQVRPRRPRPSSCWSATTTVRAAAPRWASAKATDWVESTVSRRTTTPGVLPLTVTDPAEARDELGVQRFLLDEPLPLLCDDVGGRALGEVRLRQLALQELDALGGLGDLLLDPLALGGEVHDAREVDVELRAADERHERRQEPQGRLEHANQGRLRARTLAGVLGVIEGQLRDLQIPVAELVPQELVQHGGRVAEPVFLERGASLGDGRRQPALDPDVGERRRRLLGERRVEPAQIREDQARGVPDLVGEVPVALDALLGDPDVATLSERREREAEGVGPVLLHDHDRVGDVAL